MLDDFGPVVRPVVQSQPHPGHRFVGLRLDPEPDGAHETGLHLEAGAKVKAGVLWVRVSSTTGLPGVHGLEQGVFQRGGDVDDGTG